MSEEKKEYKGKKRGRKPKDSNEVVSDVKQVKEKRVYTRQRTTLSARQKAVADYFLLGYKLYECYEKAGYACKNWTRENKSAGGHRVIHLPIVQEYIAEQRENQNRKVEWTRNKALRALTKVVDETPSLTFGGGNQIVNAVVAANKMCGFDKPEEDLDKGFTVFKLPAIYIGKAFIDINRDIDNNKYREYWFEGGRGSLKSSFCALKFIEVIHNNPNMCGIAMRSVGNTLGDSVYSQLMWAIETLGLQDEYKGIKSPYEITRLSTGQKIYFRGLDDANKIKSIRPPKDMYIAVHWYEEFDQVKGGMAAVRKVDQSLLRGGNTFYQFKSYNTPQSNTHFVNVEKVIPKPGRIIHKSNYLEAPEEWLGKAFLEEAEHLKNTNPEAYANEYMGEITGVGGMVFTNLSIREITQEEYNGFNQEYQGLDFGWFPDPNHWSSCYFNAAKRILYISREWRANKKSNTAIHEALTLEDRAKNHVEIIADSANPKDIQDLHDYGLFISGAKKPPNSVNYSMKWLANLSEIVIDTSCPHTAREFSAYELEKDKDGNYTSVFPDSDDHSIAAVRYALNRVWMRKGI